MAAKQWIGPAAAVAVTARTGFSPQNIGFGGDLVVDALCFVPLLLWLLGDAANGRLLYQRRIRLWPVFLFAVLVALSPLVASYKFAAIRTSIHWLSHLALLTGLIQAGTAAWRPVLAAAAAGGVLHAAGGVWFVHAATESTAAALAQYDPDAYQLAVDSGRLDAPVGAFLSPNVLASFLILTGSVSLACMFARTGRWRWCALPGVLLVAYCFLLCKSIGGFLGAGVALLLFFFTGLGRVGRQRIGIATGCALGTALFAVLWAGLDVAPLNRIGRIPSVDVRGTYWLASGRIFLDQPLTGVGLDNFGDAFLFHREPCPEEPQDPHNSVIRMFTELGALGGIAFLAAWHVLVRPHFKRGMPYEPAPPDRSERWTTALVCAAVAAGAITTQGIFPAESVALRIGVSLAAIGVWLTTFFMIFSISVSLAHRVLLAGLCGALVHSLLDFQFDVQAMSLCLWTAPALLALMCAGGKRPGESLLSGRRRKALFVVCGILWVGVVALSISGLHLLSQGDTQKSMPFDAEALVELADRSGMSPEERRALLEQAIALRPRYSSYHARYAMLLFTQDAFWKTPSLLEKIEHELKEAVWLDPKASALRIQLGHFYQGTARQKKAVEQYRVALEIDDRVRDLYPKHALSQPERDALATWIQRASP